LSDVNVLVQHKDAIALRKWYETYARPSVFIGDLMKNPRYPVNWKGFLVIAVSWLIPIAFRKLVQRGNEANLERALIREKERIGTVGAGDAGDRKIGTRGSEKGDAGGASTKTTPA
jgi:hypothetical protein